MKRAVYLMNKVFVKHTINLKEESSQYFLKIYHMLREKDFSAKNMDLRLVH